MKFLTLCRHASAQSAQPGQSDQERQLSLIGNAEAEQTGLWLSHLDPAIDKVIQSPSNRTKETAKLINQALQLPEPQTSVKLYQGTISELLHIVSEIDSQYNHVLMVGHYPGMNLLADLLSDSSTGFMSPSNAIQLELHLDKWNLASRGCANVKSVFTSSSQ